MNADTTLEDPNVEAVATEEPHERRRSFVHGARWVFWRHLCFGGLAGALVFFCASLTPSLLPRGWVLQGVVSGVTTVIGYGLGSMLSSWIRKAIPREPRPGVKRVAWLVLAGATVIVVPLFLFLGAQWQETTRKLMEMELLSSYEWAAILVLAAVVAALFLVISRTVRGGTRALIRLLDRWVPRSVAYVAGVVVASFLVVGFVQGFLFDGIVSAVNATYSLSDDGTSPGISQPTSSLRSGGPHSLVPWDTLGVKGRDFAGDGWAETVTDLRKFARGPVHRPIRAYVGLKSADSLDERVDLAVKELERTGAFERKVLVIVTTTGTGWVDANVSNSIEYMYGGDTAIVGIQYSYLPSWISFLVDRSKASDAGQALISGVTERWQEQPADSRAKLLVFGESLGSYGTEHAFDDLDDLTSTVDGALLEGPTFVNPLRNEFTDQRDPGSPEWRPVYEGGRVTRFEDAPGDFERPSGDWKKPRVAYLQNATDPISFFSLDLLWERPGWLDDPRGPDVTPDMFWFPGITFWQVAADLAFSTGVPDGHGHSYGVNAVDGWVAIAAPDGWTAADTDRLKKTVRGDIQHIDDLKEGSAGEPMTGQGRAPTDPEDLWRPRHWRDRVGGKPLDGFFFGVVLVAFSWSVVANLWLPSAAWIAANCAFAVVLLAAALRAGLSLDELGMRRDYAVRGLLVGAAAAMAIVAVLTVAVALPATREFFDDSHIAKDADSARVFNILVRIPFGTVVFEEILFRGVLLALAMRRWSVATAVLVTAVLFGLWHIVPASESASGGTASTLGAIVGTVAVTTAAGVLFAWLRLRASSIVAPMLAHAATNSLAYLAVVIALQLH